MHPATRSNVELKIALIPPALRCTAVLIFGNIMITGIIEIVIDTREQTPWHFDECYAKTSIGTLRIGDYALKSDLGFAVERKSLDDFLGTIGTGWKRFQNEIQRAKVAGFVLPVVVEGRLEDCCFTVNPETGEPIPPQHSHPRLSPGFVLKRIGEIQHIGGSVFFAENQHYAMAVAYSMLYRRKEILEAKERNDRT